MTNEHGDHDADFETTNFIVSSEVHNDVTNATSDVTHANESSILMSDDAGAVGDATNLQMVIKKKPVIRSTKNKDKTPTSGKMVRMVCYFVLKPFLTIETSHGYKDWLLQFSRHRKYETIAAICLLCVVFTIGIVIVMNSKIK